MSNDTPSPTPAPRIERRAKMFPLLVAVILIMLMGGAGGGYWWYLQSKPVVAAPPPEPGIVTFEPFLVNLADSGSNRFLRLTLRLLVEGEEHALEIQEDEVDKAKVRSAILELLTAQQSEALTTQEGKVALKKAIATSATKALHDTKVVDVLFTEFVVQF
jgi:flagellar protein FliL